jgi:hypothetical protein
MPKEKAGPLMGQRKRSQLWTKIGMGFKEYHKCQNNMGQLWVKIRPNTSNGPTKGQNKVGNFGLFYGLASSSFSRFPLIFPHFFFFIIKIIITHKQP